MPKRQNPQPDEVADDVISDPARDDKTGSDWTVEGGATEHGPATDVHLAKEGSDEP